MEPKTTTLHNTCSRSLLWIRFVAVAFRSKKVFEEGPPPPWWPIWPRPRSAPGQIWPKHLYACASETAERNSVKLYRKQELNVLYQVCVFVPIGKIRWLPWPLIGWDIFNFSSETAERNSMKLDRKQDLNVLYQFCVFWADRKNKMAALASDWLRHFRLLLWNLWREFNETWQEARSQYPLPSLCFLGRSEKQDGRPGLWLRHFLLLLRNCWTEFNETLQEARSQCPLPSLCFSGGSEKQNGRPGLWLAETFSTSPLKLLNGIQWNLTGSKISMSSNKFVFFGRIIKQKWPPWLILQKGGTLYSGARYVALWASCFHLNKFMEN